MTEIISFAKVLEHERLSERLAVLRASLDRARAEAPDAPASATLAAASAALLRDIYCLISREPGARALPRLAQQPTPHRQLATVLRDAGLALDLFRQAHRDHHDDYGEEWLTVEAIESAREARGTYPRSLDGAPYSAHSRHNTRR